MHENRLKTPNSQMQAYTMFGGSFKQTSGKPSVLSEHELHIR